MPRLRRPTAMGLTAITTFFITLMLMPSPAFGSDHAYYNDLRIYGRHLYFTSAAVVQSATMTHHKQETAWRGYGVENGVGTMLFRFFHLELSHTMVSMTSTDAEADHISGSKVGGKVKMSFRSPVGNLELGVGGHAGSYGFIRDGKATDLTSAGHQVGLGLNYFTSDQISVHGTLFSGDERWSKTRGAEFKGTAETAITGMAFGLSLWR